MNFAEAFVRMLNDRPCARGSWGMEGSTGVVVATKTSTGETVYLTTLRPFTEHYLNADDIYGTDWYEVRL